MSIYQGPMCRQCGCVDRYDYSKRCVQCWRAKYRAYYWANHDKELRRNQARRLRIEWWNREEPAGESTEIDAEATTSQAK